MHDAKHNMVSPSAPSKKRSALTTTGGEEQTTQKRQKTVLESPDAITLRNQQRSPLLRLPSELRNKIYDYIFDDVVVEILPAASKNVQFCVHLRRGITKEWLVDSSVFSRDARECIDDLAIWRVCRQLHAETALQLFAKGEFTMPHFTVLSRKHYRIQLCSALYNFVSALTVAQRGAIQQFLFEEHSTDDVYNAFSLYWKELEKNFGSLCREESPHRYYPLQMLTGLKKVEFNSLHNKGRLHSREEFARKTCGVPAQVELVMMHCGKRLVDDDCE